jgi:hypothetical protein
VACCLNAHNPLDALQAIAAGVGLLVFLVGMGLAELIAATRQDQSPESAARLVSWRRPPPFGIDWEKVTDLALCRSPDWRRPDDRTGSAAWT